MKNIVNTVLVLVVCTTLGCSAMHYSAVPSAPITDIHQSTSNLRYIDTITLQFADREIVLFSEIMAQASSKYPHKIMIDNVRYQYVTTSYLFGFMMTTRIREVVVDVYRSNI